MNYIPISERTFNFAVRIVKLCSFLDEKPGVSRTISYQLLKAGTSIGANTAESKSGQSRKDFLNKLEIALKEARETCILVETLSSSRNCGQTKAGNTFRRNRRNYQDSCFHYQKS